MRFEEVLRFIVPMTYWWCDKPIKAAIASYQRSRGTMKEDIDRLLRAYKAWAKAEDEVVTMQDIKSHVRYIALAGLILWAQKQDEGKVDLLDRLLDDKVQEAIVEALREQLDALTDQPMQPLVWHVARNRP